jgi:GntR family transcriptional regulator, transcriptional repressor for pyruvate dehydrogenase complex
MAIKSIKKTNISEEVFEQLKQQLLLDEWKQGEKIPSENELATALGVSRVTIRQAIQRLAVMGLIETKVGEGSFVKKVEVGSHMKAMIPMTYLQEKDMMQVLDFRYVIEIETAAMAAKNASEEDVKELRNILEQMEALIGQQDKFAEADLSFHFKIAEITQNSLIIETFTIVQDILATFMKSSVKMVGEIGIPYHRRLVEAFANQDSESAREIMREHMVSTKDTFKNITLKE